MPAYLATPRFLPSYTCYPMQFLCIDGVQGDYLARPATASTDPPTMVSQIGYNLGPNLISALTSGTATYTQVAAQPGEFLQVFTSGDIAPLVLGTGGCTAGALLGPASTGAVMVAHGSGLWYGAVAQQAGNAGEIVETFVTFGTA